LDWIIIRTEWRTSRTLKFARPMHDKMAKAVEQGGRARLHLTDISVPLDKSAVYRLYVTPEAAKADEGPGSKGYLGTFSVVLNDRERKHVSKQARHVVLNLAAPMLERLSATPQLAFVERGAKPDGRKVMPLRAKDVHFSVAEVERASK
jgi:hypothetical protein